jgi:hypothetical protein
MATKAPVKTNTSASKATTPSTPPSTENFAFGRENYILLVASVVLVIIGYALMSGGKTTDPKVFDGEIFNFRRITLAPIVVLIGYAVGIYSIVKKAD